MAVYNFVWYHEDDATLVSDANPIDFNRLDPGMTSEIFPVHLWNDKGSVVGADTAPTPRIYSVIGPDDVSAIFTGTTLNGFKSFLEARSCRAFGVVADLHTAWTPIGPNQILMIGNMPPNSMREIELRWRIPVDAAPLTPEKAWQLKVTA